jgi:hypothetical protein
VVFGLWSLVGGWLVVVGNWCEYALGMAAKILFVIPSARGSKKIAENSPALAQRPKQYKIKKPRFPEAFLL